MARAPQNSENSEAASAQATKAVVDDAMRTDILGPNLVKVLTEHALVKEEVQSIAAKSITDDPDAKNIRKALESFIDEYDAKRKGRLLERALYFGIGAVITGLVAFLFSKL